MPSLRKSLENETTKLRLEKVQKRPGIVREEMSQFCKCSFYGNIEMFKCNYQTVRKKTEKLSEPAKDLQADMATSGSRER